jgi:hypothetical protein
MEWLDYVSYFFGGVFLTNAVPHFVSGVMGRPFQSPFAKPPGQGLSSSTINVLWGYFNLAVGYLLTCRKLRSAIDGAHDCSWVGGASLRLDGCAHVRTVSRRQFA